MAQTVLNVRNLVKKFGETVAVNDVSFSIKEGEILAYLGHNGAGKTTTIRTLLGLLKNDGGDIEVFGTKYETAAPVFDQVRRSIGICLDAPGFYPDLSATDNLAFYAELYGLDPARAAEKAAQLLKLMELYDVKDKPVSTYSKGMQQKLSLIRAIQHDPKILFLDEPMNGLDPATRVMMRNKILDLAKKQGMAIMITSHDLGEVEQVCDDIIILEKGSIRLSGALDEIKNAQSGFSYEINTAAQSLAPEDVECVKAIPGVKKASSEGNTIMVTSETEIPLSKAVAALGQRGIEIKEFKKNTVSLEQIYFESLKKHESPAQHS